MSKFIITLDLQEGTQDRILDRAPEVQAATRAKAGCLQNDFFTCIDNPNQLSLKSSQPRQQHRPDDE